MNKLTTVAASFLIAIFFVVSDSVHASGATEPPKFFEMRTLPGANPAKPITNPGTFIADTAKPNPAKPGSGSYALSRPLRKSATVEPILVVYIHDQGSNVMEPYQLPQGAPLALSVVLTHAKPLALVSVPAGANWGTEANYKDISLAITETLAIIPAKEIILMGQTMGGSMALNYAALAPEEIKEKITGVICAKTVGDLKELYKQTRVEKMQFSLRQALGGLPDVQGKRYKERGCLSHISDIGKNVKVGFIESTEDPLIPTELQAELVSALRRKKLAVKVVESPGPINPIPPKWSLVLDFCLYKGLK